MKTIENDAQLNQTLEQMCRLYRVLVALRTEIRPFNARNFAIVAEGPLDQLQELQEEVDAYVGISAIKKDQTNLS